MSTILFIDTTKSDKTIISVESGGKRKTKSVVAAMQKSQAVLPAIEEFLHELHLPIDAITSIVVHPGPGSFTGVRVGIAVASALGVLLRVPVNGKPPGSPIKPVYADSKFD